jgi:hypothetical protein
MSSPEPPPTTTDADMIGTQQPDMDAPLDSQQSMFRTPQQDSQAPGIAAVDETETIVDESSSQLPPSASNGIPEEYEGADANTRMARQTGSSRQDTEMVNPEEEEQDIRDSIEHAPVEQPEVQARVASPIFEPERSMDRATAIEMAAAHTRAEMPPPSVPPRTPRPHASLFARIRQVQRQKAVSRAANNRSAASANSLLSATPDRETYLESVLPKRPEQHVHRPVEAIDDDDEVDKRASLEYRSLKKQYDDLKRKNGSLTFKQDIEWMKIQRQEDFRKKKRARDLLKAQEEDFDMGLFPDDHQPRVEDDEADDSDNGPAAKRRKPDLPRKKVAPQSLADLEHQSMMVQLEADGDLPVKRRKGPAEVADSQSSHGARSSNSGKKPNAPKTKSKTSKSAKATRTKAGKAPRQRQSAKEKKQRQQTVNQLGTLFSSNVFVDQAAEDAADQPTFTSKNKKDALKELIASVPDQKEARSEMAVLAAATRDFDGRGSAKADGNGMWLVKGMKTSLKGYQLLGSAFMRRRENAPEEPRGGLLADHPGLGKTLMMLGKYFEAFQEASVAVVSYSLNGLADFRSEHREWASTCWPCQDYPTCRQPKSLDTMG